MAKNVAKNPEIEIMVKRVEEMELQLKEALDRTSGLVWNTRNWEAVKGTLEVQEQRFQDFDKELQSIKNLVMTMQRQFQQFEKQRAIELQHFVNFGPTATHEKTDN